MKLVFGALLSLLLIGCTTAPPLPPMKKVQINKPVYVRDVTREAQGWRLVEEGALLVDVRDPEEYRAGHLRRAINIPLSDMIIGSNMVTGKRKFKINKKHLIVVYGSKAQLAGVTRSILIKHGFANAHDAGSYEGMLATKALNYK